MKQLYKTFLILSALITVIGALFKIQHWPAGSLLISVGLLLCLVYIIIALIQLFESKEKSLLEKLLWLIGFIALTWIAGIVYYFVEIKKQAE
jgi:hypothetical protein